MTVPSIARSSWSVYLTLTVFAATMIGAMLLVLHTGTRMSVRHSPLVDAVTGIKLEATTAHLWFEEILSGDRHESMEDVWSHLDSADRYVAAMLEGDRIGETDFVPLEHPGMRRQIGEVRDKLAEFRSITSQRWRARHVSAAGTDVDQQYDDIFEEFLLLADDVEAQVRRSIAKDLGIFRRVQISLIAGAGILSLVLGLAVTRNLAERERAAVRLRQSEEQWRLTFENSPISIAVLDTRGRFVRVNPALCDLLGYAEPELLELDFEEVTHPDDAATSTSPVRRWISGEVPEIRIERRYVRKDGRTVHGLLHGRRIPGTPDRPTTLVGQIVDRTDQVKAEEEVRQLRDRLAHVTRVSTIGEMATGIAHEINQPLTAISAAAQACRRLLRQGRASAGELADTLDQISRQALRAGEVIRHLRSFIRKREPEREPVQINDLVRNVARLAEADARMRDFHTRLELAPDLPPVVVDPIQIQQVLLNLIRNGMEAMDGVSGGEAEITVITGPAGGEGIEVRVVDRGVGLSDEAGARLFHPFFTTKRTGLGMGLSISRSIVTSHGGRMWFTRNVDRGATLHFSLPTTRTDEDATA